MTNELILDPLEFLVEFTQHIPPTGSHMIRYYGCSGKEAFVLVLSRLRRCSCS